MKKYYFLIIVALILGLVLTGCTLLSNIGQVPTTEQNGISYLTKHTEGDPFTTDLIAGGGSPASAIDVGDVLVWNDGDTLYVKYVIYEDGWCLTETHLHVAKSEGEIPQTKKGNPIPGQFDYKSEHDCVTDYTIQLNWCPNTELFIAAHAVVQKTTVITAAPYYASTVVSYIQGLTKGGTSVRTERSTPEQGLIFEIGQDEHNFFSLGFGGWIIVEFDCPIQNGEGNDVKIIEDTWGLPYPLEKANVFASQDGITWTWLGVADNTNLDVIHTISEFDLGILNWAKYIKVEDISDPAPHNNAADAYDLNAVESLQDCVEIQEETAWGAGFDFPGKNWATYFKYIVQPLTLYLYEKDPSDWSIVDGGAWGKLEYYPCGSTFDFVFNGHGLEEGWHYQLIYYPDPWPGSGLICLGGDIADENGDVHIMGPFDTGNLPAEGDENEGAKIWLVLSSDVSCGDPPGREMVGWNPTEYLFENELITFTEE